MLRKIADIKPPCRHSDHNPPSHMALQPGVYEHTCSGCGKKTTFTVNGVVCSIQNIIATNAIPMPTFWVRSSGV